jgi:O-antigen/teichoic acid export membrane protein
VTDTVKMTGLRSDVGDGMRPAGAATASVEDGRALSLVSIITTIGAIQAITVACGLAQSKVAALIVGPAGIGIISFIDGIVVFVAQLSGLSLPFAAMKGLAFVHDSGLQEFARGYAVFLRAVLTVSVVGATITIGAILLAPEILVPELASHAGLLVVALIAIPAMNMIALLANVEAASRHPRAAALMGLASAAAMAIGTVTGVLTAGLVGFYVGAVASGAVVVVGCVIYLARWEGLSVVGQRGVRLVSELRRYPRAISFAGAQYTLAFTVPFAYLVARYAMVRHGGFAAAGLLQASMALAMAMRTLMRSSNALLLTPAMNRNTKAQFKFQEAVTYFRTVSVMIGVGALPLVLFPRLWLSLVYSSDFVAAAPYVHLFVLAEAFSLLAGVNQALVIGLDHIGAYVAICLIGQLGMAAVAWCLAPALGIFGVALGFLFNGVTVFGLSAWLVWRRERMQILRAAGWPPLFVIVTVATAGAGSAYLEPTTFPAAIVKVAICLIAVAAGLWILGVHTRFRSYPMPDAPT